MPVHTRMFTADELADFPDDGNRYEVIDGELLVAPTTVRSSPVTEVQPDLLVFSGAMDDVENSRQVRMSSLWLAVEILSPSTLRLDRVRKRKAYLEGGVREYWIVDGKARAVEVWSPGQTEARVERGELAWQPRAEHPALTIDLVVLFRDLRRDG